MTSCRLDTFYKLRSALARHRAIADTTRELTQTSDRALAEMGIARGDIASIAADSGIAARLPAGSRHDTGGVRRSTFRS